MSEEKRMAGTCEIILAFSLGDKEIVIGEDPNAQEEERYMCAFCSRNALFEQYHSMVFSDDYHEVTKVYGQRIVEQSEQIRKAMLGPLVQGIDNRPISQCDLITWETNLSGKVVVIKPDILRREYRVATHQLLICTGGFGAHPQSRGNACYCVNLYSGEHLRYERQDILGTIEPEQLPKWAQLKLDQYLNKKRTERSDR